MLTPGTKLGPYEVLGSLGAGGMGEVYRARDPRLQREVALKILPDSFAADVDRLARFQREAQTLAALNHPHIAGLYGLEESSLSTGTATSAVRALVMELVEGEDLSARIARGPLPLDEALPIAQQIAEALEAAHEAGIVHRDLKPANIKVRADGTVKVLDFGLAKAIDTADGNRQTADGKANSPTITSPMMTMGGVILGTAAYMSPEQAKGRAVDRRADIWAFGCVLYEMLTGKQAFEGEDVTEILGAIVKTEADWTRLPASTPTAIRTLLKRCLTKDTKRRLQHIGDARIEIGDAATGHDREPTAPAQPASSSKLAWGIAGVLGILAAGAMALAVRPRPEPLEIRLEVSTPRTTLPGSFAISPDGRSMVFAGEKDNTSVLWLRTMDAASARPLPGTENATSPFWSPDNRSIGFGAGGQLKRLDVAGGLPQIIAAAPNFRGGTWNKKGEIIFAPFNGSSLFRVSASGGDAQPLTTLSGGSSHRWPVFLPDDDHFLFIEQSSAAASSLQVASLTSPSGTRLLESETAPAFASPDFVFFGSQGALYAQRLDVRTQSLLGERLVAIRQETGSVGAVAAAADAGTFVYRLASTSGLTRLSWRDRSGKRLEPFFDAGGNEPDLSPDGRRAAVIRNTTPDNIDLWLIDLARSLPTRFTSDPGAEVWPTWSPDSSQVAFGKPPNMYLKSLSGAQSTLLETPQLQKYPADWSRDGKFLLYRTNGVNGLGDVWALPMTGERKPFPVIETPFDETRPQFSPDGRWVSYESTESKRNEVYVRRFNEPGATIQISVGGGSEARWHPSGRELFYIGSGARMMSVDVRPSADGSSLEVSAPHELFSTMIYRGGTQGTNLKFQYAVSPDGGRFLINEVLSDDVPSPLIVVMNWKPSQ